MHGFVDGLEMQALDVASWVLYNASMVDGVPNFVMVFGYSNVSWTRKVVAAYICRMVQPMDRTGADVVIPRGGERFASDEPFLEMTSGYVKRAKALFPKQGTQGPWRSRNNVIWDTLRLRFGTVTDAYFDFRSFSESTRQPSIELKTGSSAPWRPPTHGVKG